MFTKHILKKTYAIHVKQLCEYCNKIDMIAYLVFSDFCTS